MLWLMRFSKMLMHVVIVLDTGETLKKKGPKGTKGTEKVQKYKGTNRLFFSSIIIKES